MLAAAGFSPRTAWRFDLYGGTVLLAAQPGRRAAGAGPDEAVRSLLADDARVGVRDPAPSPACSGMCAPMLRACMTGWRPSDPPGRRVLGYGAASRAVALLCQADVDRALLPAVVDASPAKQGLRMPGTDIPVVSPAELAARQAGRGAAVRPRPAGRGPGRLSRRSRPQAAGGCDRCDGDWAHAGLEQDA